MVPAIIALCSAIVLFGIRVVIFKILHRWARRTKTNVDDIVIDVLKFPSIFWCLAIGIYIGVALSELSQKYVHYTNLAVDVIVIFSITIAAANLSGRLLKNYVQKAALPIPTTGLAFGIVKGVIVIIGMLIILTVLGISITPLLTALGVGGLAVALALQDTLANLFAGIHILMEKSVRLGDFIRLESGQEGFVADITWRTTRVKMLPNNTVIIPNSSLAKSVVVNYSLPDKRMSLSIPVSVGFDGDPEIVERVLVEEAVKAAADIPGLLAEPVPFARFNPGFGPSSLDFTLICQVREFTEQYEVQHELRKRILKRFRQEGIEIPFPQRVVHLKEEREIK